MVAAGAKILQSIQQDLPSPLTDLFLRGIEKEALRITSEGDLSQQPHPLALGSKLTHPTITTDYSEALLEFITPPMNDLGQTLAELDRVQSYATSVLEDEVMWAASMPCFNTAEEDIPIADYGCSPIGQMKTIYRRGLAHRYGKLMQTIAGLHYNISFPEAMWQSLQEHLGDKQPLQAFINQRSMGLVRNFIRYNFAVNTILGATPAMCRQFDPNNQLQLQALSDKAWYGEAATSLRMSDIGYHNDAQAKLNISYNSLEQYVSDLLLATATQYPGYSNIPAGADNWQQLNDSLLQIEAEYYASIRPKRVSHSGERQVKALSLRGVEYFEIRALDLNPYSRHGISEQQLLWLEVLLLHCLLNDSPPINEAEQALLDENHRRTVISGRKPQLLIHDINSQRQAPIEDCLRHLTAAMLDLAEQLDEQQPDSRYYEAVASLMRGIDDKDLLLSSQMITDIQNNFHGCYYDFAMHYSHRHRSHYLETGIEPDELQHQQLIAKHSLSEQKELEANNTKSLATTIDEYFS